MTVEPVDPLADHIEFFVDRDGAIEGHQAKRQVGNAANWTLRRLETEGILKAAKAYADLGRRFSFVSTIPAEPFAVLVDAARRADDYPSFSALIVDNANQRTAFDTLARCSSRGVNGEGC